MTQQQIAKELQLSQATISTELQQIRKESREILQQHFEENLPTELRKASILCDVVLREAKEIMENTEDARTKTDCLRLIHAVGLSKKDLLFDIKAIDPIINMVIQAKQKFRDMASSKIEDKHSE